jgi:hypothetical protein
MSGKFSILAALKDIYPIRVDAAYQSLLLATRVFGCVTCACTFARIYLCSQGGFAPVEFAPKLSWVPVL